MSGGTEPIAGDAPVPAQAARWFARLRADDAGEQDRGDWRRWMDSDPAHRDAYERLEAHWAGFGELASHPEIAIRLAAIGRSPRGASTSALRARRRPLAWLSAAAALLLAVALPVWWNQTTRVETFLYATAIAESRSVTLADGTQLDLDADTRLEVAFSKRLRRIAFDRGRAYFSVASETRPMRVETAFGQVEVVGTEFEIDQRARTLDVTLVQGRLDVTPHPAGASRTTKRMQAGQRLRIDRDGAVTRLASATEPATWRSGRLVFDNLSLSDAVAEFNRYRRQQIRLADPSLGRIRVSGTFRSADPSGFVEALGLLYGVSADTDASGGIVLSANSQ